MMTSTGESEGVHMECLYSLASNITIKNSRFENCAVMDVFFTRGTWWTPPQPEYGGWTLINNYFDAPRFTERPLLPLLLGDVGVAVQVRPGGRCAATPTSRRRRAAT